MEVVLPAIAGQAASALVGGLIGKKDKAPATPPPVVAPVTPMPDPYAQKQAQRRKATMFNAGQLTSASTVLTGGDDKLGA